VIKRIFDLFVAGAGLLCLLPFFPVVALLIKLDSPGPVFFRQERIGKDLKPFFIYKLRTMVRDASERGSPITSGNDSRITRVGSFLRRRKLDELPQLLNVLKGDMSIVGPRPELRIYVDRFRNDYQEVLRLRPGITDLASIRYRDEAAILGTSSDPDSMYLHKILPEKISLGKEYVRRSSLVLDLVVIFKTVVALRGRKVSL
jgi:lipopolysaccharide/colanic/teichoic acid biosynthesis glycosyltransferase